MKHDTRILLQPKEKTKESKKRISTTNDIQNNTRQPKLKISQQKTSFFKPFNLDRLNLQPKLYIEAVESLGITHTSDNFDQKVIDFYNCLSNKINLGLTKETKVSEILKSIVSELKRIKHPESEWMLHHNEDNETVVIEWLQIDCDQSGACIPVGYLPDIKSIDEKAHDALVKVFQFIYQRTRVNFVGHDDEWGFFESIGERLSDYEDEVTKNELDVAKNEINSYRKGGECYKYYHLIKKQKHIVLSDELNFKTPIIELNDWIDNLVKLFAKEYYPVQKFDFNYLDPYSIDGQALVYSQYIGFYWKQDYVFKDFDEMYNQIAQEIGIVGPSWTKVYGDGFQNGEIKDSQWPREFHELMQQFNELVLPKILEYYGISKSQYID